MEKRLGRGLGALIPDDYGKTRERVENIKIVDVIPNKLQPRKRFNQSKLGELINSIKEKGVIQPVLVRQAGDKFELIAGERRWRAAKELDLAEIPAIVRNNIDNVSSLEISLIENIQREELTPLEEANAYKELIDKFEYSLDTVGKSVGKDKSTVSNSLRLLNLSQKIQNYLEDGIISTGHAKTLLSVLNEYRRDRLADLIAKKGLSVRQLEQLVLMREETRRRARPAADPELKKLEEKLQHKLGTKVNIIHGKKRGRIEIQYFSNEDLLRVLKILLN